MEKKMILADKIINERKKNGWSQEELAEKLSVSRQSVSKWEGALAVPDLQKILLMAELFGVSTDYLLKDEIEPERDYVPSITEEKTSSTRKVSLEEANEFIIFKKYSLPKIAMGVALCITCPVILILLVGFCEANLFGLSENLATGIGIGVMFVQLIIALITFITVGEKGKRFDYLETKDIDTEYGVVGLARELKEKYQRTYTTGITIGVCICLVCLLPLVFTALAEASDLIFLLMVDLFLLAIATGVSIFILVCGQMDTYNMLLQERDFTSRSKKNDKKLAPFSSIYWLLIVSAFLAYSFISNNWKMSWIFFAVGGVFFPVYRKIVKLVLKIEDEED